MFAASDAAQKAKAAGIHVIDPAEIEELGKNKMVAKKLANKFDFFLSEVPHMGSVGRFLGVVLGPRGKMPRPYLCSRPRCNRSWIEINCNVKSTKSHFPRFRN